MPNPLPDTAPYLIHHTYWGFLTSSATISSHSPLPHPLHHPPRRTPRPLLKWPCGDTCQASDTARNKHGQTADPPEKPARYYSLRSGASSSFSAKATQPCHTVQCDHQCPPSPPRRHNRYKVLLGGRSVDEKRQFSPPPCRRRMHSQVFGQP
jgi:hypothetical protein